MTTTDPVLKDLIADTTAAETAIPLTLYLPSGQLFGTTTTHEDFCHWATVHLGQESGYTGTVPPTPDPEYVHLAVTPLTMGDEETVEVVRVRLSDVVAWTVG